MLALLRTTAICFLCAVPLACKSAPPPKPKAAAKPKPKAAPPPKAVAVSSSGIEKMRQKLRISPLEMVFSGVRGLHGEDTGVAAKNVTDDAVQIREIRVVGEHAASFQLLEVPNLPRYVAPDKQIDFYVGFEPPADAALGLHRATLQILIGPNNELAPLVDISALVTAGEGGANEPPLSQVVQALGYQIDVGGTDLSLGTDAAMKGEEVPAGLFRSIKPGNIALDPVARFSPDEQLPYGFYRPGANPELHQLGILAEGEAQKLNPGFQDGQGQIAFDPGREPFGIYVTSSTHTTYTENNRNFDKPPAKKRRRRRKQPTFPGTVAHATRVFPLKSRNGTPIDNAYLVTFEEARNGDYQDTVFVLWNVERVTQ